MNRRYGGNGADKESWELIPGWKIVGWLFGGAWCIIYRRSGRYKRSGISSNDWIVIVMIVDRRYHPMGLYGRRSGILGHGCVVDGATACTWSRVSSPRASSLMDKSDTEIYVSTCWQQTPV